jgi:hypothetical protein
LCIKSSNPSSLHPESISACARRSEFGLNNRQAKINTISLSVVQVPPYRLLAMRLQPASVAGTGRAAFLWRAAIALAAVKSY